MLTHKQAQVLTFVRRWQRANMGESPTFEQIAEGIGVSSKSTVSRLMDQLEDRGALYRLRDRHRAIFVPSTADKRIPIYRAGDNRRMGYLPPLMVGGLDG